MIRKKHDDAENQKCYTQNKKASQKLLTTKLLKSFRKNETRIHNAHST